MENPAGMTDEQLEEILERSDGNQGDNVLVQEEQNARLSDRITELEAINAERSDQISKLGKENLELRKKDEQVCALIAESRGVEGLHLNGDIASWEELMHSVHFSSWLDTYADDFPLDTKSALGKGEKGS